MNLWCAGNITSGKGSVKQEGMVEGNEQEVDAERGDGGRRGGYAPPEPDGLGQPRNGDP